VAGPIAQGGGREAVSVAAAPGMPFSDLMGVEILIRDKQRVIGRLAVRDDLCTAGGILHGGACMAFADALGALGAMLNLPPDARTATIESKTNFLRGAPAGSVVTGEATPLHIGRRSSVWQTRLTGEDGKLMALTVQTQLVVGAD
jgi:1,4-dihydroxy-2-naphthoyl-CoA hydrolase